MAVRIRAPFRVQTFHYRDGGVKSFLQAWGIVSKWTRDGSYLTWGYRNIGRLQRRGMRPC
jgi:hypothetical protein